MLLLPHRVHNKVHDLRNKPTRYQSTLQAIRDWDAMKPNYPFYLTRGFYDIERARQELLLTGKSVLDDEGKAELLATGVPYQGRSAGKGKMSDEDNKQMNNIRFTVCSNWCTQDKQEMIAERQELQQKLLEYQAWKQDPVAQAEYKEFREKMKKFHQTYKHGKPTMERPPFKKFPTQPKQNQQLKSEQRVYNATTPMWRLTTLPMPERAKVMSVAERHHRDLSKPEVTKPDREQGEEDDNYALRCMQAINEKRSLLYSSPPAFNQYGM